MTLACVGVLAASVSLSKAAWAQACCASAGAVGTGRLAPHEDAIVGVGARAVYLYGSLDRTGTFLESPANTAEFDFEQDIIATMRVLRHGQLTAIVPIVETYRQVPGMSDAGGGLGDVQLGARYDFIEPGSSPTWPGVALSFNAILPTSRPPESAESALATDATGTGGLQAGAQLSLERSFKDLFVIVSGSGLWRAPRNVGELHEQRGPLFTGMAAVGYSFPGDLVGAFTFSYAAELDAHLEGAAIEGSGHELTRLGLSAGYAFSFDWRMQAGFYADLPAAPLSRNQPLGTGLSLSLLKAGW